MRFDHVMGVQGGLVPGFLSNYKNPADEAMGPLNQIPGMMEKYYGGYRDAGMSMLPGLQQQYANLTGNPGGMINQMGEGYKQSPGFDFALKQALNSARQSAAAGGMAGSPMHEQESMDVASGLASRDYNQWLQNAMGMYGMGLQGQQGIFNTGYNASDSMAQQIAQALAAKSGLKYAGQAGENQRMQGAMGGLMGLGKAFMGGM